MVRQLRPLLTTQIVFEKITKQDPKAYDSILFDTESQELISFRSLNCGGILRYVDSREDCN